MIKRNAFFTCILILLIGMVSAFASLSNEIGGFTLDEFVFDSPDMSDLIKGENHNLCYGGVTMSEKSTDPIKELEAMTKIAEAVSELDDGARRRVFKWAVDRFQSEVLQSPSISEISNVSNELVLCRQK